jgi:hypothetical protein
MNAFNLSIYEFTEIDDQELQTAVKHVTDEFPRVGETMIRQILYQRGIKVIPKSILVFLFILTSFLNSRLRNNFLQRMLIDLEIHSRKNQPRK